MKSSRTKQGQDSTLAKNLDELNKLREETDVNFILRFSPQRELGCLSYTRKCNLFAIYGVKSVAISVLIWVAKMIQFIDIGQCIVCRM